MDSMTSSFDVVSEEAKDDYITDTDSSRQEPVNPKRLPQRVLLRSDASRALPG
eukprot:CAMPEP_0117068412 /NCGR_PEP_ID=MMETSP0472-20121206/47961_1 /TAXON_ID=693140 ORGANISM="Tiarina fusus, Strain LIS" /NCGR_SAMPLE_ID=MMETSP0472 /ASSEMBLY_ACC=CAM_ASM_000603 /LENGTH=52 /DNA_ID=CAMNT_0004790493 /DNA_START=125 /DNA_END=279 /DNA_ORIENTATION=-